MSKRGRDDRRPARILHVVSSLEPGGLENGLINIIRHGDRTSFEHAVVCLEEAGRFASRLPADVPLEVAGKRRGNDARTILAVSALARRHQADLVHTRNWASLVEGALAARASAARHVHGLHGKTHLELGGIPARRRMIERWLCARADRVYALLPCLESDLADLGVPLERRAILENGVDLERFAPDPAARARLRAALGVKESEVLVGSVARLDPVKDYATLIRACARLPGGVSVVVAGDGPLRRSLEQLAFIEGQGSRIRFLGHREEPILPALDIFVLASRYEGFSNTILEAMACGLPVVATRTGGNPSLVTAETGILVSVGDAAALGAAVAGLVQDGRRRRALGAAALRFARERPLARMARAYEALYAEALSTPATLDAPPLLGRVVAWLRRLRIATPDDVVEASSEVTP